MTASVAASVGRSAARVQPSRDLEHREPRRRLRVAPPPRRRLTVALVVTSLVVVASLFSLVGLNILLVQGQFELGELSDQIDLEQRRYEALRLEVAELASPARIIEAAGELGLSAPESIDYVEGPVGESVEPGPDASSATLAQTWAEGKEHLAPGA